VAKELKYSMERTDSMCSKDLIDIGIVHENYTTFTIVMAILSTKWEISNR
jgi:hypothetical protein